MSEKGEMGCSQIWKYHQTILDRQDQSSWRLETRGLHWQGFKDGVEVLDTYLYLNKPTRVIIPIESIIIVAKKATKNTNDLLQESGEAKERGGWLALRLFLGKLSTFLKE